MRVKNLFYRLIANGRMSQKLRAAIVAYYEISNP